VEDKMLYLAVSFCSISGFFGNVNSILLIIAFACGALLPATVANKGAQSYALGVLSLVIALIFFSYWLYPAFCGQRIPFEQSSLLVEMSKFFFYGIACGIIFLMGVFIAVIAIIIALLIVMPLVAFAFMGLCLVILVIVWIASLFIDER
jgi:hypothetical protein